MKMFETFKMNADLWRVELIYGDNSSAVMFVYAKYDADVTAMAKGWLSQSGSAESVVVWNTRSSAGYGFSKNELF